MHIIGKLVRDNVPSIIEERGQRPIHRVVSDAEMPLRLNLKLKEELDEVVCAMTVEHRTEELADLLEVIYAYTDYIGVDREELERVRQAKFDKRGGFSQRVYLVSVEEPLSEEEIKEREEAEILSRAMANPKHRGSSMTIQVGDQTVTANVEKLKELE